jgi:hypothetical protein
MVCYTNNGLLSMWKSQAAVKRNEGERSEQYTPKGMLKVAEP